VGDQIAKTGTSHGDGIHGSHGFDILKPTHKGEKNVQEGDQKGVYGGFADLKDEDE
jgi:hypothetical protein